MDRSLIHQIKHLLFIASLMYYIMQACIIKLCGHGSMPALMKFRRQFSNQQPYKLLKDLATCPCMGLLNG